MADVAVVGSGLAGFTAYQTLRRSLEPGEIAVFGTDADPAAVWRIRAAAIRQRAMRSESDGHCGPATFPGLALRSVGRRRSLKPLLETVSNRYHPTVEEFLDHVERTRKRSGWDKSLVPRRVERVRVVDGGFELEWLDAPSAEPPAPGRTPDRLRRSRERFQHVLLAPGHPGLNVPDELRDDPRAVHSYEPHEYGSTVTVVGAGLAAATEWLNALAAGAEVISVRRREPARWPLNVPREYFSRRGLAAFHRLPAHERIERLRALSAPSYPAGWEWDEPLEQASREGRFRVESSLNGSAQVICATGFLRGWRHDPLLSRLVADHDLATADDWIVVDPDSTVPALSDATRTLALAGAPGQWAFPAADTLAGARYAGHWFLRRVKACRTR
jgi:cation diffusion facilitator CzcD-associated flavoprotein CzcO